MRRRILASVVFALLIGAGAYRLEITDDASAAMLPDDPSWLSNYEHYSETFPGDQAVTVLAYDLLCTDSGWQLLSELHSALSNTAYIRTVISLPSPNTKVVRYDPDLVLFDAFSELKFDSESERCHFASNYPPYKGTLVARNGKVTSLIAFAQPGVDAVDLTRAVTETVSPFKQQANALGGRVEITGEPVLSAEVALLISEDSRFVALVFLVMLLLLYLFTGSSMAVASALVLNIFVLVVVYGSMGWLGIRVTPATTLTVFLLVPISSAFVIHAYAYQSRLQDAARIHSRTAFLIAGLSTCIGFAATGFTPAPDIQNMAIMGVIGIFTSAIGIFLFVFPILSNAQVQPIRVPSRFALRLLGNPYPGYLFLACLMAYSITGLFSLHFNYSPMTAIPETNHARQVYDEASDTFGSLAVPVVFNLSSPNNVDDWSKIDNVVSIVIAESADPIRVHWLHPHLNEATKAFTLDSVGNYETFPSDDSALAQLLLLFSDEDLALYLSREESQAQVTFQAPFEGSAKYLEMRSSLMTAIERENVSANITGRVAAFFEAGHRIGMDTIRGLIVSSLVLLLVLWFLFRSVPLAFCGVLINVLPVAAGLATLGHFNIPVEMGSSIVAAIAFGILLDDSMHLLVRVRDYVRQGYDPSTSVLKALNDFVGAITATSITIAVGFAVLFFAQLQMFADFALVILVTLLTALVADVLVLPLLVRRFYKDPVT